MNSLLILKKSSSIKTSPAQKECKAPTAPKAFFSNLTSLVDGQSIEVAPIELGPAYMLKNLSASEPSYPSFHSLFSVSSRRFLLSKCRFVKVKLSKQHFKPIQIV